MRITRPTDFYPTTEFIAATPLIFNGSRGEQFQITVLEDDIIRVEHWPDGKPRLNRTWTVVGQDGDVPREGRRRDDLSPFSLPEPRGSYGIWELEEVEKKPVNDRLLEWRRKASTLDGLDFPANHLALQTASLRLRARLDDLRLEWIDLNGQTFAADLRGRAYEYDRDGKAIFHYMERQVGEHYGFGETAGALDKYGSCIRLNAMGYNAETGDPNTHTESFDYMLGDNLLVASLFEEGARTRSVYLPAGRMWCDFWTGKWYEGGQTVTVDAPLERIPLFAQMAA